MCNGNCNQGRSCTCSYWGRYMRMVIGKKIPLAKRDNNGNIIRHELFLSPDFPECWVPSRFKLEKAMDKIKLKIINYHNLENIVVWEKK